MRTLFALTHDQRRLHRQIKHRRWLDPSRPPVEDQRHLRKRLGDLLGPLQRLTAMLRRRRRDQWPTERRRNRPWHRMIGHANADLGSLGRNDLRHLTRRRQDERVRPRQQPLEQPIRRVVNGHIAGNVRQVHTDQRQRLRLGHPLPLIEPLDRCLAGQIAAQPVDGIRRVGNDLTRTQRRDRSGDLPWLRVGGVYLKQHARQHTPLPLVPRKKRAGPLTHTIRQTPTLPPSRHFSTENKDLPWYSWPL